MPAFAHPHVSRRTAIQGGAVGLFGLGLGELNALRAAGTAKGSKSVIFLFLSGGLAQHESFDPKPDAPENIRGEFGTVATRTPGFRICEHLPMLAACSDRWAVVRSLTHKSNDHSAGHHIMLTGRSDLPAGFNPSAPRPSDHPSMASVVTATAPPRNNLPPAVVLPDKIVHNSGRVIPGQFAGIMGAKYDPWLLEMSAFEPKAYGAYPEFEFDHQQRKYEPKRKRFVTPQLSLPDGVDAPRFDDRMALLRHIDGGRRSLDHAASAGVFDKARSDAASLLTDSKVRKAFDVAGEPAKVKERYGNNAFGWSCLLAARLVEAGVRLVQVNLGNNETWDTHGNAFPHLKEKLLPPTDRAVTALLEDLTARGLLDDTLIVMAGEFGRTPKISTLTQHYKGPGRDHWGAVQSVLLAGGGVKGGTVIGASDKNAGYPSEDPQTPENLAATIYHTLGLPKTTAWTDAESRPHHIYHGEPIKGLG
jgi:uncharacterized protein (DUF1501 family)